MSVTTHTNVINPQVILSTLGDYEVQHSGGPGSPESRAPAPNSRDEEAETAPSNPINWPTDRRGVPAHRPINRALNLEERPGGSNGIEQTFIFFMFTGVDLTTVSSLLRLEYGACADDLVEVEQHLEEDGWEVEQ